MERILSRVWRPRPPRTHASSLWIPLEGTLPKDFAAMVFMAIYQRRPTVVIATVSKVLVNAAGN
jgi:hypothetical protein